MILKQALIGLKCNMQVVVDEEQFKLAGRKLAAHLADPEVEVIRELYKRPPLIQDFEAFIRDPCFIIMQQVSSFQ